MFELPLLPNYIAYGQIQRRISRKYGVFLIPKRYFAGVLSGAAATTDGLHLSQIGTRRMATIVSQVFRMPCNRALQPKGASRVIITFAHLYRLL
jgi:hypothetical protein